MKYKKEIHLNHYSTRSRKIRHCAHLRVTGESEYCFLSRGDEANHGCFYKGGGLI